MFRLPFSFVLVNLFCASLSTSTVFGQTEQKFSETIGPISKVSQVAGDLKFTEGPTPDDQGNLYFTDIPANKIYKWTSEGELEVFLEPSGHANGLLWTAKYGLLACQMDGQVVAIDPSDRSLKVLAKEYQGKRFNAPNDLVVDSSGGIYFTDPLYRAPTPLPQATMGVYYIAANGTVTRVIESLPAPNGINLSPDEKTLYVIPSQEKRMWKYAVTEPGKLGPRQLLCELAQPAGSEGAGSGGDGCAVDTQGNIYITTGLGVQVISPGGERL
ncbi:MAG: SMP-30/gluconolactonase/LRE family protein, partial [Planctomycetota bacterium]|nr:SMP-30/gluconolactonase/LRE family protein [Planctomycetota bacterium]